MTASLHMLLQQLAHVLDTIDEHECVLTDTIEGKAMISGVEQLRPCLTTMQLIAVNNGNVLFRSDAEGIWKSSCRLVTGHDEGSCLSVDRIKSYSSCMDIRICIKL